MNRYRLSLQQAQEITDTFFAREELNLIREGCQASIAQVTQRLAEHVNPEKGSFFQYLAPKMELPLSYHSSDYAVAVSVEGVLDLDRTNKKELSGFRELMYRCGHRSATTLATRLKNEPAVVAELRGDSQFAIFGTIEERNLGDDCGSVYTATVRPILGIQSPQYLAAAATLRLKNERIVHTYNWEQAHSKFFAYNGLFTVKITKAQFLGEGQTRGIKTA